jgi:hypothetical protein
MIKRVRPWFLVGLLSGCSPDDTHQALVGLWAVDSIVLDQQDVTPCLSSSFLGFDEDGACQLPFMDERCADYWGEGTAHWTLDAPRTLSLDASQNKTFAGTYRLRFGNDTLRHLLVMTLSAPGKTIICKKVLTNYQSNQALIQRVSQ